MMEDYQTTEHVKEEVQERKYTEFVEVDSQDVHQLCTACLCATRTTRTLDDDALKQYYMHILAEMQPEGGVVVLQSPRVCWECVSHLKRSVRFREQVQDSYRQLQQMLEDVAECLPSSVSRPDRLKAYVALSIDIAPQDDDAHVMTVTKHDDDGASECLDIERHFAASEDTVTTKNEELLESFRDEVDHIIICVDRIKDDLVECPLVSNYEGHKGTKDDVQTRTEVSNDIKSTPNFTHDHESAGTSKVALERHIATYNIYPHNNKTVSSLREDCAVVSCSDDQCSECPNKQNLLQHNNMKTNICHTSFSYKNSLLRDKRTRIVEKPLQCKVCNKSFSQKSNLVKHIRIHTGEKPYLCEMCQESFSEKASLCIHIRTHTGEKPYLCKVCNKSFSQKGNLVRHITKHTGEKPYLCEMCHESFSGKASLVVHIRTHTGEKPYMCKVCNKSFSQKGNLVKHVRIHTGEKPYLCEMCHESFSDRSSLVRHIRKHTGEKPYLCKLCHKSFSEKGTLVRHIRNHTGEKPYLCEMCHKSFSLKVSLVQHIRTHTGEKPFQCMVCNKSFVQKYKLKRHLRTHTGEKPFRCEVCLKPFTRKSGLIRHKLTHTDEKPF